MCELWCSGIYGSDRQAAKNFVSVSIFLPCINSLNKKASRSANIFKVLAPDISAKLYRWKIDYPAQRGGYAFNSSTIPIPNVILRLFACIIPMTICTTSLSLQVQGQELASRAFE